ncbi:MAG TPA: dTMP kinase [Gammaproteobacteria bacterium]|nr:dTMP kinase [Gammaproteobacteria bacterium]
MKKTRFITLEGSEGAGKSTNMDYIQKGLRAQGIDIVTTREPGGTPIGEDIRQLLLGHKHTGMSDDTELLLMFAARAEHLDKVIRPALEKGQWVLCDRFTDATYAYQGGGRGIASDRIATLENWTQAELRPDLTIYLDVPIETGRQRAGDRSAPDRFEKEQNAFFNKARKVYLDRAEQEPARFRVIDASTSLDQVQVYLDEVLQELVSKKR